MASDSDEWILTFASPKELSESDMTEVARRVCSSVGYVGKVEGKERWDYHIYSRNIISKQNLEYMKENGFVPVFNKKELEGLVSEVFPDRVYDLTDSYITPSDSRHFP